MKIIICGHTRLGSSFVVGSHQLYRAFGGLGHDVIHFSLPVSMAHFLRIGQIEVRERFKNALGLGGEPENRIPIQILHPSLSEKFGLSPLSAALSHPFNFKSSIKQKFGGLECDVLIIDHPNWYGAEGLVKADKIIYRPTDVYASWDPSIANRLEPYMVNIADRVIATSEPVRRNIIKYGVRDDVDVVENGVDLDTWNEPPSEPDDLAGITQPRAIYTGALDERFDFGLIEEVASLKPEVSFVLIGPNDSLARKKFPKNVYILGARPYSKLKDYLGYSDVALLPLNDHPANSGRSPMKIYEYAASGLGVIAKSTDELRRRNDEFVFLYNDKDCFIKTLDQAIAIKHLTAPISKKIAADHSWRSIAEKIIK